MSLEEILRERLSYDPDTGHFTWLHDIRLRTGALRVAAGSRAGTARCHKGYRQIQITVDGKLRGLKEHRLAWWFVHGEWPPDQIDHINGDPADNRIANLRLANNSLNMANRKPNTNSASPYKGVSYHRKRQRWIARIQCNKQRIQIGEYKTPEEAADAYARRAKVLFGSYARLS